MYWALGPVHALDVQTAASALVFVNGILLLFVSYVEHVRSVRPSTLITVYLGLTLLLDCAISRTLWLLNGTRVVAGLLTSTITLKIVILMFELWEKRSILLSQYRHLSPEVTSSILNRSVFWWLNSLIKTGFYRMLSEKDMYSITTRVVSSNSAKSLQVSNS